MNSGASLNRFVRRDSSRQNFVLQSYIKMDKDADTYRWIGDNGWFEFKEISNPDRWLDDYRSYQQEIWKSSLPVQQSLF